MYVCATLVYRSTDGGSTWSLPLGGASFNYLNVVVPAMVSGQPEGDCFILGSYRHASWMNYTYDHGETFIDKTGNLGDWLDAPTDHDEILQIIPVQSGAVL